MTIIKTLVKKIFGFDENSGISPIKNITYVGSEPHGYWIPGDFLNADSICYCVGAGDDISFDTELKTIFNSRIYIFDPTPAAKEHFMLLKDLAREHKQLPTLSQDSSYRYKINFKKLEDITFIDKGVWSENTVLKFYDPGLNNYVSHSVYLFKDSDNVIELPVDSIKNFMTQLGHSSVDLLKLEIEGAEYEVINSITKDNVDVKIILVEFDEIFHTKGFAHFWRIRKSCKQLKRAGYVLVHSTKMLKRTFIRKDVFNKLKANK